MKPEEMIRNMFNSNALMNVMKIQIKEVHCGGATLVMPIDLDIHTNHWLGVHGGALATLADSTSGVTAASVGKVVQTLTMNIEYVGNIKSLAPLVSTGKIIHKGKSTINVQTEIRDEQGNLFCVCSTIMFVFEDLKGVPEEW